MKTKMTAKKKRAWLGAIGKLERFYRAVIKGRKLKHFFCPLCEIESGSCTKCLWPKFQKESCGDYSRRKFKNAPGNLQISYSLSWAKDSLKRLARWRKRLGEA